MAFRDSQEKPERENVRDASAAPDSNPQITAVCGALWDSNSGRGGILEFVTIIETWWDRNRGGNNLASVNFSHWFPTE